jgi:hypothetical protein
MTQPVGSIYRLLASADDQQIQRDTAAWTADFEAIHGSLERKRLIDRGKLAQQYRIASDFDLPTLLFAVDVWLSVRMRLLTASSINAAIGRRRSPAETIAESLAPNTHPATLIGITNYYWPGILDAASRVISQAKPDLFTDALMTTSLQLKEQSLSCKDWYQDYYSTMVPKEARHALGSYYTPTWLVDHTIRTALSLEAKPEPLDHRIVLDPTAGSGAFLVGWARTLYAAVTNQDLSAQRALEALQNNCLCLDINPMAIFAAKSNLTAALAGLIVAGAAAPAHDYQLQAAEVDCLALNNIEAVNSTLPFAAYDLIIGNPPWVNWEYMPPDFRSRHESLWPTLGLFSLAGREKSFSKEDVSALFFHFAIARFLSDDGICSMVLPQSLFKSSLNARGFRRFWLKDRHQAIRIRRVDDFSDVRPFENVANKTVVAYADIAAEHSYPVPYVVWERSAKAGRGSQFTGADKDLLSESHYGRPATDNAGDSWITGPRDVLQINDRLAGKSAYRARTGLFTGGANGVYHLEVLRRNADGTVTVRNVVERAKRVVEQLEADIEDDYVFPFLRGREVQEWHAQGEISVLLPHTASTKMRPVLQSLLAASQPLTLSYLQKFEAVLAERRGFTGWERESLSDGFYAVQRVGDYTFSPYKVVWRYIAPRFTCAVALADGGKPIVPNEKLMLIACKDEEEAYYVCGLLSSSLVRSAIESKMVSTQIAPHVIENLAIPLWNSSDPRHTDISLACRSGHAARKAEKPFRSYLDQVDAAAADLFGTPREAAVDARRALLAK